MPMPRTNLPLLMSLVIVTASLCGCSRDHIDVVRDGRTTWRSSAISFERNGGSLDVHVDGVGTASVTILLFGHAPDGELSEPMAAAAAAMRPDGIDVRFTGLPSGRYVVGAFEDLDGDGALVRERTLFSSRWSEPNSGFKTVELLDGGSVDVTLAVMEDDS